MCIAITDESGQLIGFERMQGGRVSSTTIPVDKAFTASAARKATHDYSIARQPGASGWPIGAEVDAEGI